MAMPNFLIVGAARAATTSLHHWLSQHPELTMSTIKEPNYFLFDRREGSAVPLVAPDSRLLAKSVSDPDAYERLFRDDRRGALAGEASPLYLYVRETPELIAETIPDVKVIAVLRDPIERALSHHAMLHVHDADGGSTDSFRSAAEVELRESGYTPYATGTHLLRLGRYGEQLARYQATFRPDQLLVLDFAELSADPSQALVRITKFLDVDPSYDFENLVAYNGSRPARSEFIRRVRAPLSKAQPWLKGALPAQIVAPLAKFRARVARPASHGELPTDLHERLVEYYRDDVERLGSMIDLNVSGWLGHG